MNCMCAGALTVQSLALGFVGWREVGDAVILGRGGEWNLRLGWAGPDSWPGSGGSSRGF